MHLLLHSSEELLQIWFDAISDLVDRFLMSTPHQKISWVEVEIFNVDIFSVLTQDSF